MRENRLVEIPIEDLQKLRDLYSDHKTEVNAYNMIQNYIDWFRKDPYLNSAKYYSLNGDWSDGTFVLKDSYLILFDTLDRSNGGSRRLKDMLCLFDYTAWSVFNGYNSRLQFVVEEIVDELNLNASHRLNDSYDLYVLRRDFAVCLVERTIPDGMTLEQLSEVHAEEIDKIWDFRHEGSLNATRNLIKYGKSLGAFSSNCRLVGWIIVQQTGVLGLLKVHEDYRKLGIASALVTSIAKEIAGMGQDVMTLISSENAISKTLFKAIGFKRENHNAIICNTLNESQDRLEAALRCLDTDVAYAFSGFPERIFPTVEKYFKQWGGAPSNQTTTIWHHIPKELALQFNTEPPEGITLSALRQEHVVTINNLWPHRFPGSEDFISHLISMNMTVGAYEKDGSLVAWIFQLPTGALGILHVQSEYKRSGYGSLLVRVLSKKFAQAGLEVLAPVVDTNTPSREMFKKLNFKEIDKVYYWAM